MKIKKGDSVMVMVGKDKSRQALVVRALIKEHKVLVTGVNQYKKHRKPVNDRPGEIITLDRPLDVSKVALVCPICKKPTRVGYRIVDAKKTRVCRKCDSDIDQNSKTQKTKTSKKGKK